MVFIDCPTILSDERLGINHPQRELAHPGSRGVAFPLQQLSSNPDLSGHLPCFRGYFGYEGGREYKGTIFRFPLRGEKSAISAGVHDVTSVRKKLLLPLAEEAEHTLLFLKSISCIQIEERVEGTVHVLSRAEIPGAYLENIRRYREEISEFVSSEEYKSRTKLFVCLFPTASSSRGGEETVRVWLLLNLVGFRSPDSALHQFYCQQNLDFLPWVGLALPTGVRDLSSCGRWCFEWNEETPSLLFDSIDATFMEPFSVDPDTRLDISTGRIFCFLPTQLDSKFPFHIHGYFSLSSNRRSVPWPAQDNLSEVGARWNQLLAESLFSLAYAAFLSIAVRALKHPSPLLYHYQLLSRWSAHEAESSLFSAILRGGLRHLSRHLKLFSKLNGGTWLRMDEALFLPSLVGEGLEHEEVCSDLLELLDQPLISLPPCISELVLSIPEIRSQIEKRFITPVHIRDVLVTLSASPVCREFLARRESSVALLDTLLSHSSGLESTQRFLEGVPLLLTADNGPPQLFRSTTESVYYVSTDTDTHVRIFPGLEGTFVDPSIPTKLHSALLSLARDGTSLNLRDLTNLDKDPALFSQLLTKSLYCFFDVQPDESVSWQPSQDSQPPVTWIIKLFHFIGRSPALLAALSQLPILPQHSISDDVITLLPLRPQGVYIEASTNTNLRWMEAKLECSGCLLLAKNSFIECFSEFVLPSIPEGFIPSLQSKQILSNFIQELETPPIQSDKMFQLIELLIPLANPTNSRIITQLPIFPNTRGGWIKLSPDTILPPPDIPSQTAYPPHFISPFNASVRILFDKLAIPPVSTEHFVASHLLPYLVAQEDSIARTKLTLYVLENVKRLDFQICNVGICLKKTEWIADDSTRNDNSGKAQLCAPTNLLDPRDALFQKLILPQTSSVFPDAACEDYFDIMKKFLAMKSQDNLSLELLVKVCRCGVHTLQSNRPEWMSTFQALLDLLHNYFNKFDSSSWRDLLEIFKTEFISAEQHSPKDWPDSIRFYTTDQLCSPGDIVLCHPDDLYLIGSVSYSLASSGFLDNSVTVQILQGIGMSMLSPEMVVRHLNFLSRLEVSKTDRDRVYRMISKVYTYLDGNVSQLRDLESSIIFIPEECKFVSSEQIVFKTPIDLRPYMYSLQQLNYEFTQFFNFLSIGQSPNCAQLSFILTRINDYGVVLSQTQLKLVISILRHMVEQDYPSTELRIYIPGKDLRLYQPNDSKLVFWDHRWLDRNLIEEEFVLVHDAITNDLAYKLGVTPFSEKVAPPSEDFWCEESGQQVSVTDRLHAILDGYYGNINVLKEMLQNADDARATEMRVVFDCRTHPTQSLLSTSLRDWQGPAILFYNDATFSERDFENIMKIDGATKAADSTTIGRFGLGFCTVYHLTDVPSFVSRNYIHILDPHKQYISKSKGGRKIDFCNGQYAKFIQLYRDQFSPYAGVFGCDIFNHSPFNGTLFRLPFRPYNISSKVSLTAFDHSDIMQLQESFVKEADSLIFFTQCVESIGIYSITDAIDDLKRVHFVRRAEVCRPPSTQPFLHAHRDLMCQLIDGQPVTPAVSSCEYQLSGNDRPDTKWIITYATGSKKCVDVLKKFPRALAPLPFSGVALNLEMLEQMWEPNFLSTLYCFLPLPIHTGLPFHCHAMFELRQDRQGLIDTVEAKTEWNKVLVSDPLVLAASTLYQHLADKVKHSNGETARNAYICILYSMFLKEYLADPLWKGFANAISKQITESEYQFFPLTTASGVDWGNFRSTNFLNIPSIKSDLREFYSHSCYVTMHGVLVRSGCSVALIHDSLYETSGLLSTLFSIGTDNIIDLKRFSQIFFSNISKFDVEIILNILKVLISACSAHIWLREMILSTGCLPCGEVGTLQPPNRVIDPNSQLIAQLFEAREDRLPNDACRDILFSDTQVLNNLRSYLGLISSKLPAEDLRCRAEYISANSNTELAVRLVEYLNQKIFTGSEVEEMRSLLRSITFIPVELPHIEGTFSFATRFCSPSEIVSNSLKPVVEFQLPVCPDSFLLYQDFISNFGLSEYNIPREISLIAVSELELCIQNYDALVQAIDLFAKVTKIYETIGEYSPAKCSNVPKNGILIPSVGFCDASRLLLASSEDFPPYIYSLNCYNTRGSRYLSEFFLNMGVNTTISQSQCQMVMEELHNRSIDLALTSEEQRIAIKFILQINEDATERDLSFLLGMDNRVHPAKECVFHDLDWDRRDYSGGYFTLRDKSHYFVHSHISNEVASRMGAHPLSHIKLSGRTSLPFRYHAEGQTEPLTTRLRNILSEYESDVDVFKELTQNADDALATEIKFLFDYSQHGAESIIHPEMKHWQGPAIYCYNNATFSDEDFKNITRLAARSKMEDQATIGTYGIGFNTVYHLTDLPSFVSRRFLTFFDPHVSYLEGLIHHDSPGMQIDFVDEWENLRDFQDQFSVYNGIFGCSLNTNSEYTGTLFRLPLRTSNVKSMISSKYYTPQTSLRDLHTELLKIANNLILFLQSIQSIEVYERTGRDQNLTLTYRVTKHSPHSRFLSVNKSHFDDLLAGERCDPVTEVSTVRITALSPPESERPAEEVILSYSSGTQLSFNLVERIRRSHGVCTLPVCAVAVPKSLLTIPAEEFSRSHCHMFCYLPLPCLSPHPMHINGSFQLQQSRRALHCTADGSIRTEWNQTLINDALPTALVNLLLSLTQLFSAGDTAALTDLDLERYYSFWPESNRGDILWRDYSSMIARQIINSDSRVLYSSKHPRRWVAFGEASIFITDPKVYTLDEEFTDILFDFAASEQIYFITIPTRFKQHDVVAYLLNSFNVSRTYSIARACREILFRHLSALMVYYSTTVKLILSNLLRVLKYESSLWELLTTEACIPCGEEAYLFRAIPEVVSPFCVLAEVFYPEDKRVPTISFCDLFDKEASPETFQVLVSLGVILLELPLGLLVDRCNKTQELEVELACKHASHLLDYINSMRSCELETTEVRSGLLEIPFIPVYQDTVYDCICPEARCVFSSPSNCCLFDRRHLSPQFKAVTRETNSLLHAMSLLAISANQVPLHAALESIFLIQKSLDSLIGIENTDITRVLRTIYLYLADGCFSREINDNLCEENRNIVLTGLADKNWILHESCRRFYPVTQTVLTTEYRHFNSQYLNCFSFTQLLYERNFKQFVGLLQIPERVTPDMAIQIILLMKENFIDDSLPNNEHCDESGFVILLINSVLKFAEVSRYNGKIYLLTESSKLQLASSLYQNDTPWIDYSDEVSATLVHHDITLYSSHRLGAQSKRDTYYDIELMQEDADIPTEGFGQYQPISNRIDNLLREFPYDVTIFKELIQNAEDAKATELAFVLDRRVHGEQSLCLSAKYQKRWKELQRVPSLLVYNNRAFTEEDLQGIQAVGIGGKQGKKTIGRFGLGFNSVFHLTRSPCLLTCSEDGSSSNFCVFDPYLEHLSLPQGSLPGIKLKLNSLNLKRFEDQFTPYFMTPIFRDNHEYMNNLRDRRSYSVFRLPLNIRRDDQENVRENVQRVRGLLLDLINEAPRLLPFISHLKNIFIFEIKSDGTTIRHGIVFSEITSCINSGIVRPICGESNSIQISTKKVSVTKPLLVHSNPGLVADSSNEVEWLIYHFEGDVNLLFDESKMLQEYVSVYEKEKLRLFSSIAIETVSTHFPDPTQKKYLYCHLPFGNSLDFPVHINCPFILDPHRRYVSYQDEVTGSSSWDNVWHSEIVRQVLTPLYFQLLLDLGPGGERHSDLEDASYFNWYYSLFPVIHKTDHGSNSMEFLQSLGREVLKLIYHMNSPILLADNLNTSHTPTWYPIHGSESGIFKKKQKLFTDECASIIVLLHYPLTCAPLSIAKSFEACNKDMSILSCKYVSPLDVLNYLNKNRNRLAKEKFNFPCLLENCVLTFFQLNIILQFILEHYTVSKAKEQMHYIPLKVDYSCNLRIFDHCNNSTFTKKYASLLPHLSELFLCEKYDEGLVKSLREYGYAEDLSVRFLASNLQVNEFVSPEFFLLFWSFILDKARDSKTIFNLFGQFLLAPVQYGRLNPDHPPTFLPISCLKKIATLDISPQMKDILYQLECPFLHLTPFQMANPPSNVAHISMIEDLLKSLSITSIDANAILQCVALCSNVNVRLSEGDAEVLRNLFPNISYKDMTKQLWRTLACIRMFVAHCGPNEFELVSLNDSKICLVSESFPLSNDLTNRLVQVFKLIILSSRSEHHNPVKLIGSICKYAKLNFMDVEMLVNSYILHSEILPQLSFDTQKELILFFFNNFDERREWFTNLKTLKFINTPQGLFKPSDLYCSTVPLHGRYKKECLLPECWNETNSLYQMIKKLGLNLKNSLAIILQSAKDVASHIQDTTLPNLAISALIEYINCHYEGKPDENRLLEQLASIPFLPLFNVRTLIRTEEDSGREWRLGCFCEAQLYTHYDYCCTACSMFDPIVYFNTAGDKLDKVMSILRLKAQPEIRDVKVHLDNLLSCFKTFSHEEITIYLEKLFMGTYKYLQECPDPLTEFMDGECILYQCKLYRPENFVMEWKSSLHPYLFQCPTELAPYKQFLSKLGVSLKPTYKHFKKVLMYMRAENDSDLLKPVDQSLLCILAKNAFAYMMEELHSVEREGVELEGMLLLTDKHKFISYDCPDLFYADDTQLLNWVSEVCPDIHILAPLSRNKLGTFEPPPCLNIKFLSRIFKQEVCYRDNILIEDERAQCFQTRLRSPLVYRALKRIYYHQTSTDLSNVIMQDGARVRDMIERLRIIAVRSIDMTISDSRAQLGAPLNHPNNLNCICFLNKSESSIIINTNPNYRDQLPLEIAYELNEYFGNIFQANLIHLLICLVYSSGDVPRALNKFKIIPLPSELEQD